MKQGKDFPTLLDEIKGHKFTKKDYVGDTRQFSVAVDHKSPINLAFKFETFDEAHPGAAHMMPTVHNNVIGAVFEVDPVGDKMDISRLAMQQICSKFKVPFQYAERLYGAHPDVLARDLNTFFNREPKKVMVRTLNDNVRAVLSNRYRILDNFDVAAKVVPIVSGLLGEHWANFIRSCEVTENKLYLKVVHPTLEAEIPPPPGAVMGQGHTIFVDRVKAAFVLTNSEVGLGSLSIAPSVYTERCTNLAVFNRDKFTKYHIGRERKTNGIIQDVTSDETRSLEDAAVLSKVADITKAALDGTIFNKQVEQLTAARGDEIEANPVDTVERLSNSKGLNQDEADEVMKNLIEGADLSRYGLHAAVTRTAEGVNDYDRASELERIGGEIIELPQSDWKVLSQKKAA